MNLKKSICSLLVSSVLLCGAACGDGGSSSASNSAEPTVQAVNLATYNGGKHILIHAWDFPLLNYDETDGYDIESNRAIMQDAKDAGFDVMHITGKNNIYLTDATRTAKANEMVDFIAKYGMKSAPFASNTSETNENTNLESYFPDFSDNENVFGFIVWDEPYKSIYNKLGNYAETFNEIYADTDAVYMVNLLPSYASIFSSGGYADYIETFCEDVLKWVDGEKFLSVDSYPIQANKTLMSNYLYDLIMVKKYADEYGATAHMVMQCCATGSKSRMPEKEEMSTEAYAALAFGMNSISWYTYSSHIEWGNNYAEYEPFCPTNRDGTKNQGYYDLKEVNESIRKFDAIYSQFTWKSVMLNSVEQTAAMRSITNDRELAKLVSEASDTKTMKSISGNSDYIIGVMEDKDGNEGFMISNYSSLADANDLTLSLDFGKHNHAIVYVDGTLSEVELTSGKLNLELKYGEGAFVVPYYA